MQAAAAMQAVGSIVQGVAGYQAGRFNRKVERINALNDERDGAAEAQRIREAARIALGAQIGAQGESGFEVGTGTAIETLRESRIATELDILNVKRRAASSAAARRAAGEIAAATGRSQLAAGLFGAASAVANSRADYANARAAGG